jgi:amino acid adenylation domain-containing protein
MKTAPFPFSSIQDDRVDQIQSYLTANISTIAGIEPLQVDLLKPLTYLGFDSLMAIDLKDKLMVDLGLELQLTEFLADVPITIIVDQLVKLAETVTIVSADLSTLIESGPPQFAQYGSIKSTRYPLSQGQWSLWFIHKLFPTSAAYNIAFTARICSPLNICALQQSVQALIDRHPSLRTTYGQEDAEPFQEVHLTQALDWQQIDAANWSETELRKQAIEIYQQPFDLESGPVLRITILTQSPQRHVLLFTVHHIAVDGVSFGILLNELQTLYLAKIASQPCSLPTIQHQYTDFVQAQQNLLNSSVGEDLWRFWQQKLTNAPTLILPSDHNPIPNQQPSGADYTFELTAETTAQLRNLAKKTGVTLYVMLLSTFQVLLHFYTGQEDILVGTPTNGRDRTDFANVVGFFVNMIVLRSQIKHNLTFSEFLHQVRQTVFEAIDHQSYPSPLIVKRLGSQQDKNLLGYFRAAFNLLNLSKIAEIFELSVSKQTVQQMDWSGLVLEPFVIPQQAGQNDLVLDVMETSKHLVGIFRYNSNLFDASTIQRLAQHFQTLLQGIIANPDRQILAMPILTEMEQQKILRDWNNTHVNYLQNHCIHQVFEQQVAKTPTAIAIVGENKQLTYQELNHKANQLAHYLHRLGVKSDELVGLCVERSLEMLVGMLAILKVGAAYVPLDPNYPPERLAYMVTDAQISLLLTEEYLLSQLPTNNAQIFCFTRDWQLMAETETENLASVTNLEDLAYVIYTSGSTGQPKGVMITQQNLLNFCQGAITTYEITSADRILQFASISFDAAVEEIYPGLMQGATIYLRTPRMLDSAITFAEYCQRWQLTVVALPTAYWHQLTADLIHHQEQLSNSLRLVIIGGERVNPAQVCSWQQYFGLHPRLINTYGPTEATVEATYCNLSSKQLEVGQEAPIGRPLANIQLYILGNQLQPLPIGASGELYIGGAGLARGYLHRPELTTEKFIANPFSQDYSARLYKTGDLARYRPDGNVEYLGRIDQQVKIRGFRVELGEVESVICQHPQVLQVTVIDSPDPLGNQQLVAYVVTKSYQTTNGVEIKDFIKKHLPHYMLPAVVVNLAEIPLNANGKVDRQALPIPNFSPAVLDRVVPPRNSTEEILAEIWSKVLRIDHISVHSNFFDLGGHSLLATALVYQIRKIFAVDLPLQELLNHPTIATLGTLVAQLSTNTNNTLVHQIELVRSAHNPTTPLPLSLSQQYIWHLQAAGRSNAALNSSIVLRVKIFLSPEILTKSFHEIIRRYEIFRTVFTVVNGQPLQAILPDLDFSLINEDFQELSIDSQAAASRLVTQLSQQPFDLLHAPLFRVALLQLTPHEQWLVVSMHHIITDGWSFNLLLQELDILIQIFSNNFTPELPPVPYQYSDFVLWQQQICHESLINQQLDYWKKQLMPINLPPTVFDPECQLSTTKANCYITFWAEPLAQKVISFTQNQGVSQFALLLACLKLALARWSNQKEILVLTTVGNRTEPSTENIIGCFINDVIIRTHFSLAMTGLELVQQVQTTINEAIAHKEVPLHQVIDHLQDYRPLNLLASFTVTSVLQASANHSNWEILPINTIQEDWQGAEIELCDTNTPLEIYVELTSQIRIIANYSVEVWTADTINNLFVIYEDILIQLINQPHFQLEHFLMPI